MSADQRVEIARDYLAAARQRDINYLPSRMAAERAETRRQLGQVLATAVEMQRDAGGLAQIRRVLAFRGLGGSRATASPLT